MGYSVSICMSIEPRPSCLDTFLLQIYWLMSPLSFSSRSLRTTTPKVPSKVTLLMPPGIRRSGPPGNPQAPSLLPFTQLFSGTLLPLFFGGCPLKMVFPKKGVLFFQGH